MRRKSFVLVIVLILLMGAIVGCGNTEEDVNDADTVPETPAPETPAPETPPEVRGNPLDNYELLYSERPPGPEGTVLSVSAYMAPTGSTLDEVMRDFGQWAEGEGWSALISADEEELRQAFMMIMGDSYRQDYYKRGNEAMIIGVVEDDNNIAISVIAGLPLSDFEL